MSYLTAAIRRALAQRKYKTKKTKAYLNLRNYKTKQGIIGFKQRMPGTIGSTLARFIKSKVARKRINPLRKSKYRR